MTKGVSASSTPSASSASSTAAPSASKGSGSVEPPMTLSASSTARASAFLSSSSVRLPPAAPLSCGSSIAFLSRWAGLFFTLNRRRKCGDRFLRASINYKNHAAPRGRPTPPARHDFFSKRLKFNRAKDFQPLPTRRHGNFFSGAELPGVRGEGACGPGGGNIHIHSARKLRLDEQRPRTPDEIADLAGCHAVEKFFRQFSQRVCVADLLARSRFGSPRGAAQNQ